MLDELCNATMVEKEPGEAVAALNKWEGDRKRALADRKKDREDAKAKRAAAQQAKKAAKAHKTRKAQAAVRQRAFRAKQSPDWHEREKARRGERRVGEKLRKQVARDEGLRAACLLLGCAQ